MVEEEVKIAEQEKEQECEGNPSSALESINDFDIELANLEEDYHLLPSIDMNFPTRKQSFMGRRDSLSVHNNPSSTRKSSMSSKMTNMMNSNY